MADLEIVKIENVSASDALTKFTFYGYQKRDGKTLVVTDVIIDPGEKNTDPKNKPVKYLSNGSSVPAEDEYYDEEIRSFKFTAESGDYTYASELTATGDKETIQRVDIEFQGVAGKSLQFSVKVTNH